MELRADILEDVVTLAVQQQVSTFVATTTGVNASPTLLKRELVTTLSLQKGEVVVMGGLQDARDARSTSGLPGVLSIFGARSRDTSRSELILLLEATPAEGGSEAGT